MSSSLIGRRILKGLAIVIGIPMTVIVLLFGYLFVGTMTGFFEWQDEFQVRRFELARGQRLSQQLERRLRARGLHESVSWYSACYGASAVVKACIGPKESPCALFDYYHDHKVHAGNPLAQALFPELPPRDAVFGGWLDNVGLEALNNVDTGGV